MITFKETNAQVIQADFPKLFRTDARYYTILHKDETAGLYGIIDRGLRRAEVFMTVLDPFKYRIIHKKTIHFMMNEPFRLGFTESWTWTMGQSWIKLLKRFEHEGVEFQLLPPSWDDDFTKIWFRKRA